MYVHVGNFVPVYINYDKILKKLIAAKFVPREA